MRWSEARWWAGIVGLGLCLSGCTGTGQPAATTNLGPFDPPSRFDLTRAVELPKDDVLHGTLHGTEFYSVSGGALRATDLLDSTRSWYVDLPGGAADDRQMLPVVVGSTVLVATGHIVRADDPAQEDSNAGDYTINLTGIDTDTHTVAWNHPIPAHYDRAFDYVGWAPDPEELFSLDLTVRNDGVLVEAYSTWDFHFATMLIDATTGQVRWQVDTPVLGPTTGRYAVASTEKNSHDHDPYPFGNLVVFDLETGQAGEQLDPSLTVGYPEVDPSGDDSHAAFQVVSNPPSYLRFSSADGTTESFVPTEDDIRYVDKNYCRAEPGQSVMLCGQLTSPGLSGVDRATGKVLWVSDTRASMGQMSPYHGYAYSWDGVLDVDTGQVVNHDTGLAAIGFNEIGMRHASVVWPTMVNEYGAMGRIGPDRYVWVPASG